MATVHSVWPAPGAPIAVDSVAYAVQPACADPSGTKNDDVSTVVAAAIVQNDSMLRRGNAMSRAPISSGTQKLPKPPIRMGVTAKKIMIVPCIVNSDVYAAGEITPPAPGNSSRPTIGTGSPGRASCHRISIAITPPTARKARPRNRNCLPITLWSVEKTRLGIFTSSPGPAFLLRHRVGRVVAQAAVGLGAGQPRPVFVLGRGDEPGAHLVVADAAVLGAADLGAPGLLGLEPEPRRAARDGVDLGAV